MITADWIYVYLARVLYISSQSQESIWNYNSSRAEIMCYLGN